MLIVEGPDNAGKSTLIRQLEVEYNLESIHAGGPPKDLDDIRRRQAASYRNCFKRVIQDRNYLISDVVYGNVLRRYPCYENFRILIELLNIKPLIIYCRPSLEHLLAMKNHEVKEHETQEHVDAVKENQRLLVKHYDELMKVIARTTTVIQYDFMTGFTVEQRETIKDFIDHNEDFYERAMAEAS